eukprot:1618807-Rhodomonas_salina.1
MFNYMCAQLKDTVKDNNAPPQFHELKNKNCTTEFKVATYLYDICHSVDFEVLQHVTGAGCET